MDSSQLFILMILSSTLLLNSARFASETNIRIVEPYLYYYSINTSRVLLFANPFVEWNNGKLITATHNSIINKTYEEVRIISQSMGNRVKEILDEAKGYRELFSYRFPAKGIQTVKNQGQTSFEKEDILNYCRLIVELTQFNSEIIDASGEKNITNKFELNRSDLM